MVREDLNRKEVEKPIIANHVHRRTKKTRRISK